MNREKLINELKETANNIIIFISGFDKNNLDSNTEKWNKYFQRINNYFCLLISILLCVFFITVKSFI